jgi:hypothetical protein
VLLKSTPAKDRTLRVDKGPMFLRKLAGREEPSSHSSSRHGNAPNDSIKMLSLKSVDSRYKISNFLKPVIERTINNNVRVNIQDIA